MLATARFDGSGAGWCIAARRAIRDNAHPQSILWSTESETDGLFGTVANAPDCDDELPPLPRLFAKLTASVSCHRDPARWDALYAVLWRMVHGEPELLTVVTDPAVHRLVQMHRNVKRSAHKMKAFVRFRMIGQEDAGASYVAWFEPSHNVVELTAPFFVRRFPSMRWSILTPDRCAHWDLRSLTFSDGVSKCQAPTDDALEELWRTYYANIFNPARLNGRAMRAEMPRMYWHNLPEARIIAGLQTGAPARVRAMLAQIDADPEELPSEWMPDEPVPRVYALSPALDVPGEWDPVHDPGASSASARGNAVDAHTPSRITSSSSTLRLGVAGWTDPTLLARNVFYPEECTTAESRLRYYSSRYPMVEADSTYYVLPTRAMSAAWAARTPDDFIFDVKAHALMTGHPTDVRRLPEWLRRELPRSHSGSERIYSTDLPPEMIDEIWARFRSALDPLRASNKLGAIMLQFPPWFEPTRAAAATIRRAKQRLGDDLGAVELRNRAWMEGRLMERTLGLLRELEMPYVIVDAPPGTQSSMPPTVAVTDPRLAIIRLHGQRVATWEASNDPVTERYRYLYDADQLRAWVPAVRELMQQVPRVQMIFNNNHANYATTNAMEMSCLLSAGED